jgi:hypothetical protein
MCRLSTACSAAAIYSSSLLFKIKTSTPAAMPPPKVAETNETFAEIRVSVRLARPLASTVPVLPSRWT